LESGSEETTTTTENMPIELKRIECAKCLTCLRSCPFDAIAYEGDKIVIHVETCQLCGICAAVCPEYNIELAYYDTNHLIDYVRNQKEVLSTDNLVLMCRGSSPQTCEILDVLQEQDVRTFIPLRMPCVGRVPVEFYLQAFNCGIKKIITVQCDEAFCKMKRGSEVSSKNLTRLQELLKEVGLEGAAVSIKNPHKAVYITDKCVGCDKCGFICPYNAITLEPLSTPHVNFEDCKGCGACALVCPHLAIQLEGFEYETSLSTIQKYTNVVDEKKAKGISPVVLAFCCQWAEFSALDKPLEGTAGEKAVIIEIPCFNGLDPVQVLNAFNSGFDGVISFTCSDDDCKSGEGRGISYNNIKALNKVLKGQKRAHRFEVCNTSPRNLGEFTTLLESFIERIGSLPKATPQGEDNNV
jgi:coenzyme F420-reducing hydrogenase delta subunit